MAGRHGRSVQGDPFWTQIGYDERSRYHNPAETRITKDNAATLALKSKFMVAGFPPGSPSLPRARCSCSRPAAHTRSMSRRARSSGRAWTSWLRNWSRIAMARSTRYGERQSLQAEGLRRHDRVGPGQTYDNAQADGMSSPIVAGGVVMVGHSAEAAEIDMQGMLMADRMAARGGVFAADIETGQMKWRYYTVPGMPRERRDGMVERRSRRGRRCGLRDDRQQLGRCGRELGRLPCDRARRAALRCGRSRCGRATSGA